ncbi:MAG TPA: gamma-glutamyl-gamma-aminobutyrate hydrolase family protein [Adhaeribacter sp.]|nr:gamma-glutamyl-gamma-aminobutyrate hydrolase family protein [Adhaeribacter sp.]
MDKTDREVDQLKKKTGEQLKRPAIGITGPDKGGTVAWLFTAFAVRLAGGKPVHITPSSPRTAEGLQGLIIGGGADVDPTTYQQDHVLEEYLNQTLNKPRTSLLKRLIRFTRWLYYPALFFLRKAFSRKQNWKIDKARDHLEFQLIDQAIKKELPVMGICRGAQLLNVYFRGTLYQDINTFYLEEPNPSSVFPVKKVHIKPGSKLAEVLGIVNLQVNALHHQAVKEPGRNMEVVGTENNKVVQAIENTAQQFVVGVQWHPEYLPQRPEQRRLFQELVKQACLAHQKISEPDIDQALAQPMDEALQEMEAKEEKIFRELGD